VWIRDTEIEVKVQDNLPLTSVSLCCCSVDFDNLTISIQLQVPLFAFKGKYEMNGKMASLPITGNGNFHTKFCT
jgi:hypothetical protein